ncbi:hypothetical protein, unlikely [Trypanosoma brucei gambiense DAL972]|uniref:Uncharacterized protein n=1 Tax=Trypanosoma brucei gambiense (strain MHOM/CI/86/DAL972) TaxID=679716 RepID=C9ZSK2_TRYB9|nr:hypothetical protein, unlikely [Trypanosoma brucei gambiense DAL972]CBH12386.1 hypothetical protein, unlikely [Trypanosoma brucei gambiense DAL972]|eukprot:XP_011774667.1 hypothetical protein, unlikely [Trypanosoma brucei gambiense DAL972]
MAAPTRSKGRDQKVYNKILLVNTCLLFACYKPVFTKEKKSLNLAILISLSTPLHFEETTNHYDFFIYIVDNCSLIQVLCMIYNFLRSLPHFTEGSHHEGEHVYAYRFTAALSNTFCVFVLAPKLFPYLYPSLLPQCHFKQQRLTKQEY